MCPLQVSNDIMRTYTTPLVLLIGAALGAGLVHHYEPVPSPVAVAPIEMALPQARAALPAEAGGQPLPSLARLACAK